MCEMFGELIKMTLSPVLTPWHHVITNTHVSVTVD